MLSGNVIDSLLNLINTATIDSNKVIYLNQLGWEYHRKNPQQTLHYARQSLDIATSTNFISGRIGALNLLGIGSSITGDYVAAIQYLEQAKELAKVTDSFNQLASLTNNLGLMYRRFGQYDKAFKAHLEAVEIAKKTGNTDGLPTYLNNLGEDLLEQGSAEQALEYFERSLELSLKDENYIIIGENYRNLGRAYKQNNQPEKALEYYNRSLDYAQKAEDYVGICRALNDIGTIYLDQGDWERSLQLYQNALSISKERNILQERFESLECISHVYYLRKDHLRAIRYGNEALVLYPDTALMGLKQSIYKIMADCHAELGYFEEAYHFHQKHKAVNDYLYNKEKDKQIAGLELQFQLDRKENENQVLRARESEQAAIINQRTIAGIAIALGFILASLIAYSLYRSNRRKQEYNKELEQKVTERTKALAKSNRELQNSYYEMERFAYVSSHDLKEPLRNINGFAQLLGRILGKEADDEIKECIEFISANARQMNNLIEDILEFSRISKEEKEKETIHLHQLIDNVKITLAQKIEEKNARIEVGQLPVISGDSSQLLSLFKNLIENGIKYNESKPPIIKINCTTTQDSEYLFSIADNGIGIEPNYYDQIFEMFKRLHSRREYEGSGLGLPICKKIVEDYDGQIWVKSQENHGSTFYFTIPKITPYPQKKMPHRALESTIS